MFLVCMAVRGSPWSSGAEDWDRAAEPTEFFRESHHNTNGFRTLLNPRRSVKKEAP